MYARATSTKKLATDNLRVHSFIIFRLVIIFLAERYDAQSFSNAHGLRDNTATQMFSQNITK